MTLDEAIKHAEEVVDGHNRIKQIKAVTLEECKRAEEYRQLAEWLKELKQLREQTSWIPVTKRLPDDYDRYLISTDDGMVEIVNYGDTNDLPNEIAFHQWDDEEWQCWKPKVTAWMPRPKAYKAEGEDGEKRMNKTKRYELGDRIFCKSWEQLLTTGLILSSKGYGVNVIGHEDMMNDVLTITALPEEKDDQIPDMRVTERMKEQEPCDTCGYEEGSIYCKEHCPHEAKKEQEPYKVSEYDKDHIWYRGVQYISLRRFLEAKTEEKNINSVLEDIKAEIKEWYWQADKQAIAKDPCVVDAMIDLFVRTIDAHISSDT